jgi:predicted short-subunit dehydrogenase-like oxidoreductase (DUF2520 family)
MPSKRKIAIIGCGNMAWHIAKHLNKSCDLYVYNHKSNPALSEFKTKFKAHTSVSLKKIIPNADAYFVCVNDASISSVLKTMSYLPVNSSVLITSGSFDLTEVKTKLKNISIFYPLQTFSKNDKVKWKETPIILELKSQVAFLRAKNICGLFSKHIIQLDRQQRLKLHLAAVLANNFTNSLFVEAEKIVRSAKKDLDISVLLPLIKQGTRKLKTLSPKKAQTGPAKRNDKLVMQQHLDLLKNNKELKQVYNLLSDLIAKQQK